MSDKYLNLHELLPSPASSPAHRLLCVLLCSFFLCLLFFSHRSKAPIGGFVCTMCSVQHTPHIVQHSLFKLYVLYYTRYTIYCFGGPWDSWLSGQLAFGTIGAPWYGSAAPFPRKISRSGDGEPWLKTRPSDSQSERGRPCPRLTLDSRIASKLICGSSTRGRRRTPQDKSLDGCRVSQSWPRL